jgi:hypothetical protein
LTHLEQFTPSSARYSSLFLPFSHLYNDLIFGTHDVLTGDISNLLLGDAFKGKKQPERRPAGLRLFRPFSQKTPLLDQSTPVVAMANRTVLMKDTGRWVWLHKLNHELLAR